MPVDGAHWGLAYELGFYLFMFVIFCLGFAKFVSLLAFVWSSDHCCSASLRGISHIRCILLMAHQYAHFFGCGLALYLIRTRGHSWLYSPVLFATPLVQALMTDGRD